MKIILVKIIIFSIIKSEIVNDICKAILLEYFRYYFLTATVPSSAANTRKARRRPPAIPSMGRKKCSRPRGSSGESGLGTANSLKTKLCKRFLIVNNTHDSICHS